MLIGNVSWYPLIDEAQVSLENPQDNSSQSTPWQEWLRYAAASLMKRTLKLLSVPIPKIWDIKPYVSLTNISDRLRQLEMKYFQDLDGIMLMKDFLVSAQGTSIMFQGLN